MTFSTERHLVSVRPVVGPPSREVFEIALDLAAEKSQITYRSHKARVIVAEARSFDFNSRWEVPVEVYPA